MEKAGSSFNNLLLKGSIKSHFSKFFFTRQEMKLMILNLLGFLIGRTVIFGFLSPLWPAYLATFLGSSTNFYIAVIATLLGIVTKYNEISTLKYFLALVIMTLFNILFFYLKKKLTVLSKSAISSISILTAGLIFSAINGMSTYYSLVSFLESILVFALAYIWDKAANIFKGNTKRKIFSSEELISISILLGAVIAGMNKINFGFVSLRDFFSILIVLVMGHKGSAAIGAASGVLLGLTLMLSGDFNHFYIAILSIAGITAGFFKELGKIGSLFGFLLGGLIMIFYLDSSLLSFNLFYTFIACAVTFLLLPKTFFININAIAGFNPNLVDDVYVEKIKELTTDKLVGFADSFLHLAKTFSNLSEKKTSLNQKDVNNLIENVSEKVCSGCGMKEYCWKSNFYNTYQTVFSILAACENKGKIDKDDIPDGFASQCLNAISFIDTTNRVFEIYKTNLIWHNKLTESRMLVSEQLFGISKAILNLSHNIEYDATFNNNLEEAIWAELKKMKIGVDSVIVLENKQGRYEVTLKYKSGFWNYIKEIVSSVNSIIGRKMSPEVNKYTLSATKILRLLETQKYRVTTGISKIAKSNSDISGDNYSFMELKDGHCLLALSDGMGSGAKANTESAAAIETLEQFMDSGFEKDIAIKMINSVLMLKSSEESFSTLDICVIDLYTGECEFAKIGAAITLLIRDSEISVIQSQSLPIGIMTNVDVETKRKKLKDGDIILMITDGISDCSIKGCPADIWVVNALKEIKSYNPQDISDYILMKAKENSKGVIFDDMTALAARIWENR